MIGIEKFNKIELRVGTIEKAEEFPDAKQPAYKLYINFGEFGNKWSSAQITKNYSIEDLYSKQIIAAMNLGNKRIGSFVSEVLVMGVDDNNSNVVLLEPSTKIENGAKVN
jgi:tRNA-binding protein